MPILNSIINWLNTKRLYQIDLFRKYPFEVQQETFLKLLEKGQNSLWGREYDYKSISTISDYQKRVPPRTYEDIVPYIEKLRRGENDVLWPGEMKWFAKSSGTTDARSKFIPVSKETLEDCHFRGGKDIIAMYSQLNPNSRILSGKGLTLGGSHQINNFSNQSFFGDLSAILIENLPFWAELVRIPKASIALMDDFEEKLIKITEHSIYENVTNIAGTPSWYLVLIKYVLDYTGKSNLLEVWPNLELFTHGGISFEPYREQYQKLIPSDQMHYLETYNASEGFFGIQDDFSRNDLLLMLDYGIFYEFIPADKIQEDNPEALTVADVKTGVNYAMVITTNSGLWRYVIGDTITFTSLNPHRIKITGRTKHFINAFGEELIVDNAEKALKRASERTGASITEYTAAPYFMSEAEKGRHEWIIEFEKDPSDLDHFIDILDTELKSLNSDYEAKRYKNLTLDRPRVYVAPKGTYYRWFQQKKKLGGQNKVPRLANNRTYIEELLPFLSGTKNE